MDNIKNEKDTDKKSKNNKSNVIKTLWILTGLYLALLWIIPIIWLILVPFKPRGFSPWELNRFFTSEWTLNNFLRLLKNTSFIKWIFNSAIVALIQTIVSVFLASFAAYVFSKMKFRGKSFLYALVFISFMVPTEAMLIPLFKLVAIDMRLSDSFVGIILPGIINIFSFVVIKNFYDFIPRDYQESAMIDGANHFIIWLKIYLPTGFSVIATMSVLSFIASWNSYTWPLLIINSPEKYTLPIALPQFQNAYAAIDLALPMAANVLATLPALIFFLIFQKQITEVQTEGGIKQ